MVLEFDENGRLKIPKSQNESYDEEFEDIANDMTHSLFHIVTNKKEIDDKEFQTILDLIETLEKS